MSDKDEEKRTILWESLKDVGQHTHTDDHKQLQNLLPTGVDHLGLFSNMMILMDLERHFY